MNASTPETLDWAEFHRQEQIITEAAEALQDRDRAESLPEPGSTAPEARKPQGTRRQSLTTARVLNALATHPKTPGTLAAELGRNVATIQSCVHRLLMSKAVVRLHWGLYGLGPGSMSALLEAATFNLPSTGNRVVVMAS